MVTMEGVSVWMSEGEDDIMCECVCIESVTLMEWLGGVQPQGCWAVRLYTSPDNLHLTCV